MRFAFTTTVPRAIGKLFTRICTSSSSEASSSMMAPRPSRSAWWIGMVVAPSTTAMSSETLSSVATSDKSLSGEPPLFTSPWYGYPVINVRDDLDFGLQTAGFPPVEWRVSDALVPYDEALGVMEARAAAVAQGNAPELVWLLEHPPLYTAGTSAKGDDLVEARFPVHETGRGGQFTYHGPGQRVAYLMLNLKQRRPDVRLFVATLEEWLIRTLAAFNVRGERREDRIGVWVARPDRGADHEDKIAAIGIRLKRWVSLHGIALNVEPDLSHFSGIVPCGIVEPRYGVTSLVDLGLPVTMHDVDIALRDAFESLSGASVIQVVGNTENRSPGRRSLSSSGPPSR